MHKLNLDTNQAPATPISSDQNSTKANNPTVDATALVADNGSSSAGQPAPTATPAKGTQPMKKLSSPIFITLVIVAVIAGVGTGFGSYQLFAKSGSGSRTTETLPQIAGDTINKGDVFGSSDEKTFKDNVEGYLEMGGFNGEGSHRLLRPGGESQIVYLTSSVTDLDRFDGMIVKIWGETFKGQKVGWLMDVGRVEVVDTSGTPPSE
jgi:hypothetical protein